LLGYLIHHDTPQGDPADTTRVFKWSRWGVQLSYYQAVIVLAVFLIPMIRLQWGSLRELFLYPVVLPGSIQTEGDAINIVFLLCTMFLPMGYALMIKRIIVTPTRANRVPSTAALDFVVVIGVLCISMIIGMALEIARLYGRHFLSIYFPIFAGLFVSGVLSMGKARTQHCPTRSLVDSP
jgi:hypothetical protein